MSGKIECTDSYFPDFKSDNKLLGSLMRKILCCLIFLLLSNLSLASNLNDCSWEASKKYEHLPKYDLALNAAKVWVKESRVKGNDKCIVEFDISDHEKGYHVFLLFLIEDANGYRSLVIGDHTGLYINRKGKVYNVFGGA